MVAPTKISVPAALTGIARVLGHAMCPGDGANPATVREWHEAAAGALASYLARRAADEAAGTPSAPGPSAYWDWDGSLGANGGVSYVTATGRLQVRATDEWLTLDVEAGPDWSTHEVAGHFARRPDGLYEWVPGTTGRPGERVEVRFEPAPLAGSALDAGGPRYIARAYGVRRPGRPVVWVALEGGRTTVEWLRPDLVADRPDRVQLLVRVDQRVFGGQISAADRSGRLAEVAALAESTA